MPEHPVDEDEGDECDQPDRDPGEEAPERRAAAVDDVLLPDAVLVGAEEARPGDEAPEHDVDEAPEGGNREERSHDRPADVPAFLLVEPEEDGGARQDGDGGGGARQLAPLTSERRRLVSGVEAGRDRLLGRGHRFS